MACGSSKLTIGGSTYALGIATSPVALVQAVMPLNNSTSTSAQVCESVLPQFEEAATVLELYGVVESSASHVLAKERSQCVNSHPIFSALVRDNMSGISLQSDFIAFLISYLNNSGTSGPLAADSRLERRSLEPVRRFPRFRLSVVTESWNRGKLGLGAVL